MKFFTKTICALGLGLALASTALAESFNTTNNLVNAVQYANYPTNAPGIATGGAIDLRNGYRTVGMYLSCDVSNNASAVVGFALVRADKTTTSGSTNWETTPVYKFLITIPAMTNHFDWMTNLPEDCTGCGYKIGLSYLTNNLASGQTMLNLDIGMLKKFTVINYP